jgi:predicted RNA-binding protein YlxR (DUF448 family)
MSANFEWDPRREQWKPIRNHTDSASSMVGGQPETAGNSTSIEGENHMPQQPPLIKWTDEELKQRSAYLAERIMKLKEARQEQKDSNRAYKDTIDALQDEVDQLAKDINEQTADREPQALTESQSTSEFDRSLVTISGGGKSVTVNGAQLEKAARLAAKGK